MSEIQMYDALTAFGRQVIYDVMELANMNRHAECIEYMFKAELNKKLK